MDARDLLDTMKDIDSRDLERLIITTENATRRQQMDAGEAILNRILRNAAVTTLNRREGL